MDNGERDEVESWWKMMQMMQMMQRCKMQNARVSGSFNAQGS